MNDGNLVAATTKSFDILREISERDGTTLNELEDALGYARSTIHAHLRTLMYLDAVTKQGSSYHVGLGILDFGGQAQTRYRSYLVGRNEIDQLAAEYETLVQVAIMEDDKCVYVYQAGQQYIDLPKPRLGATADFHSSAAGKAIASLLPDQKRRSLIEERELPAYTANTKTEPSVIHEEIEAVQSSEIAFDYEEQFEGIYCVSTPTVFDDDFVGAVSVSVPTGDYDRSFLESELADKVHKYGRLIEMEREYEDWV